MKHLVMKHLAFLSILGLAVTAVAAVPEKMPAVTFEDVFDPDANHVQGACCSVRFFRLAIRHPTPTA